MIVLERRQNSVPRQRRAFHPGGEFSCYHHLRFESVRVGVGDTVSVGGLLGQVGMSGDGYEPHLHFHVADDPDSEIARGIPVVFENVRPIGFASTSDVEGRRPLLTGEFVETTLGNATRK